MKQGGDDINVYITGDTHRDFSRIADFCDVYGTTTDDIMIILGDSGINYFLDKRDKRLKERLSELPITLICIQGNHEKRADTIDTYHEVEKFGSTFYMEEEYPNILFPYITEAFMLEEQVFLVAGGAYSIDKEYRIFHSIPWWDDEQASEEEFNPLYITARILWRYDIKPIILTHTCPRSYIPTEAFLPGVDDSSVDHTTEDRLDELRKMVDYEKWYCGHFHIDKEVGDIVFMHEDIRQIM